MTTKLLITAVILTTLAGCNWPAFCLEKIEEQLDTNPAACRVTADVWLDHCNIEGLMTRRE